MAAKGLRGRAQVRAARRKRRRDITCALMLLALFTRTPSGVAQSDQDLRRAQPAANAASAAATAPAAPPPAKADAADTESDEPGNLLLLDVVVERTMVATAMTSYQVGNAVFVPMGELARVLTLSVQVDATKRQATGFILNPQRGFDLDLAAGRVVISGRAEPVDSTALRVLDDEIYVDSALLENWWPVRLRPDQSRLVLEVQPKEPLPLQMRLARERNAAALGRAGTKTAELPQQEDPYQLATWPAIDQTLTSMLGRSRQEQSWGVASTSYLTGDLLGMEAAGYASLSTSKAGPADSPVARDAAFRLALGRSDPQGRALGLGAWPATSFSLGHVLMPGVGHLFRSTTAGPGFTLSNLPLGRGSNFSSTSFQGALPPGWEVELFYNDALAGYQQSRPEGNYSFNDLPLIFGENRFRLVFHGPQGQTRVETRNYNLDSSTVRPKELHYTVGAHQGAAGETRGLAQLEYGVNKTLSTHGGLVLAPPQLGLDGRQFVNGGMRAFLDNWLLSGDIARCASCSNNGGIVAIGLNRRLAQGTFTFNHVQLANFASELYPTSTDALKSSTKARLDAGVPLSRDTQMPVTGQVQLDKRQSGMSDVAVSARATHGLQGSTVTHEWVGQSQAQQRSVMGNLQLSRQLAGMSLRGQMQAQMVPQRRVVSGLVSADWRLAGGSLLNVSAAHQFQVRDSVLSVTLARNFGAYSMRVGLSRTLSGTTTAALQLFTSSAFDTGTNRWMFTALPGANSGAAMARVFLDRNLNGTFDEGDEPITGAGFYVNNSGAPVRTDEAGLAYIPRLAPHRPTSVSLDPASLEDTQWSPGVPGMALVPRAGRIAPLQFPVVITAEIDGYVQIEAKDERRGVSDVQLELVSSSGAMVARVRSTADGYFLFPGVRPGRYLLRVAEEQARRLAFERMPDVPVEVSADGDAGKGYDIVLRTAAPVKR